MTDEPMIDPQPTTAPEAPADDVAELDPRYVVNVNVSEAQQATEMAQSAVIEADATFRGLMDAATSLQLDPRVHSMDWIEHSHDTALEAFSARADARGALEAAWAVQDEAEMALLAYEHQRLVDERRKYEPGT